jgi:hypothetical protein
MSAVVLRRLLVTLAVVSILAPLALANHGSAATGDAPEWLVGQTWTYRGYLAAPGPPGNFTTSLTVLRVDSTSALLRTEEAWDEFGLFVAETLFSLPEFTIVALNTTVPNGQHYDFVYDRPLRLFSFPLAAGNTWQSPTFLGTYQYRVLPRTEVTTPAGVFDAFPVEQENAPGIPFLPAWTLAVGAGRALVYYSGDVGQVVRYEAFDSQGEKLGEVAITSPPGRPASSSVYLALGVLVASVVTAAAVGLAVRRRRRRASPPPEAP